MFETFKKKPILLRLEERFFTLLGAVSANIWLCYGGPLFQYLVTKNNAAPKRMRLYTSLS